MPANNKTNVVVTLSLCFVISVSTLLFYLNSRKEYNDKQYLQLVTKRYELAYNTIYEQYKTLAFTLYSGFMERFAVADVYQQLLTADEAETNRLRADLLAVLLPRYRELINKAKLRQLHFHLADNTSFLRLHRPEKFGDDLTDVRSTVEYVNKSHIPIDGFEEGKTYNGYRFVFPVTSLEGKQLGSMELSFGPEAISSAVMKQYAVLSNFLIKKSVVESKTFSDERKKAYKKSIHPDYLYDKSVLAVLKQVSRQGVKALTPNAETIREIRGVVDTGFPGSIYDSRINMIFTLIPVFNPVTHDQIAFFTIRSQSEYFRNEAHHFWIVFILGVFLLGLIFSIFYMQFTRRLLLENTTRELEKQRRLLLNAQEIGKIGHWDLDLLTNEVQFSDQLCIIFGLQERAGEIRRSTFLRCIHPDDRVLVEKAHLDSLKSHYSYDIQYRIISPAAGEKWVREICSTDYDSSGQPLRSMGVIHDISRQKEQENVLLQANRQKEQLERFKSLKTMAGAIAHRFNNAMMAIQGNLDLLTYRLPKDSEERAIASDAAKAAKGASQVGVMMLSYVGQQPVQLTEVSLSHFVADILDSLKNVIPPKIQLTFLPSIEPLICSVDKERMQEVLESVLENAVDASGEEGGKIEISFGWESYSVLSFPLVFQTEQLQDGEYVYCQITDNGHGIAPEDLLRIFEPFFTTRFVGRGLGLARTVGVMQNHHGSLLIESRVGQGTTVRVLLPELSQEAQVPQPPEKK